MAVKDGHPIPFSDEIYPWLAEGVIFSKSGANPFFLHIKIDEYDWNDTILTSHDRLYKFIPNPLCINVA